RLRRLYLPEIPGVFALGDYAQPGVAAVVGEGHAVEVLVAEEALDGVEGGVERAGARLLADGFDAAGELDSVQLEVAGARVDDDGHARGARQVGPELGG